MTAAGNVAAGNVAEGQERQNPRRSKGFGNEWQSESGGNRTPIELFWTGVADWPARTIVVLLSLFEQVNDYGPAV